ncbi:hypothetical protein J1907_12410 [Lysinibacillus sphaericus]|uniref:hypothetical protein n=2 Tax=Lysinibacillus sphaericus TaxID=1421 RepID=UPI000689C7A7|nr:hypothetical protein [Lysinibacillus sphaericus]QTB20642.1 hypothetical protein J1907_12410 [Lysinibacillus sphaericus]
MDKQQTFMRERRVWVAVFERKEGLLRAEDALDNDFCDRFVQKMHKQIHHKKRHRAIYQCYFVFFHQQYTKLELRLYNPYFMAAGVSNYAFKANFYNIERGHFAHFYVDCFRFKWLVQM